MNCIPIAYVVSHANEFPVAIIYVPVFIIGLIKTTVSCMKTSFAHRFCDVLRERGGGAISIPSHSFQNGGIQLSVDL